MSSFGAKAVVGTMARVSMARVAVDWSFLLRFPALFAPADAHEGPGKAVEAAATPSL